MYTCLHITHKNGKWLPMIERWKALA